MARTPGLCRRTRAGRPYWYAQIDGRQVGLGYDYDAAVREYGRLLRHDDPAPYGSVTLASLVTAFDEWSSTFSAHHTREQYSYWLTRAAKHIGSVNAMSLRPHHIDDFVATNDLQGTWSHVATVRAFRRLYRWARDQGHISYERSPIEGLRKPRDPESPQRVLTPTQIWYAWRVSPRDFRDVLRWYYHTGCRPEDVPLIQYQWVDTASRVVVIPPESRKKTRRIVYPSSLDRLVARRIKESRSGHLFERRRGHPHIWDSVRYRFWKIQSMQPGLYPDGFYARLFRYSFATRAIKAGVDVVTLSHLMGHANLKMLRRHYEKLGADVAHLQGAIERL